jgi:hypothetical protein
LAKFPNDHHITGLKRGQHFAELDEIGLSTARCFTEYLYGSGPRQRVDLRRHSVPVSQCPHVTINHSAIVQRISAQEKNNLSIGLTLPRHS